MYTCLLFYVCIKVVPNGAIEWLPYTPWRHYQMVKGAMYVWFTLKVLIYKKSQKLGLREKLLLHKSLKKLGPREKLLCTDVSENWDNTKNHSYIASKAGATTSLKKGGNREKCSKPAKIRITRPQKRRFSREILYISEISRYCHIKPKKTEVATKVT